MQTCDFLGIVNTLKGPKRAVCLLTSGCTLRWRGYIVDLGRLSWWRQNPPKFWMSTIYKKYKTGTTWFPHMKLFTSNRFILVESVAKSDARCFSKDNLFCVRPAFPIINIPFTCCHSIYSTTGQAILPAILILIHESQFDNSSQLRFLTCCFIAATRVPGVS